MKECKYCEEEFVWDDDVILVNDELYHKDCVKLYPTGYVVYVDDEFLGESENDEGSMAYEYIDDLL